MARPDIAGNLSIMGFGFTGSGPNAAMSFTSLKDFDKRTGSTDAEVAAATEAMRQATEGEVLVMKPPAIEELGTTGGFALRLVDRAGRDAAALRAASEDAGGRRPPRTRSCATCASTVLPSGPTVRLDVDREKPGRWACPSPRSPTRSARPWARPMSTTFRARAAFSR